MFRSPYVPGTAFCAPGLFEFQGILLARLVFEKVGLFLDKPALFFDQLGLLFQEAFLLLNEVFLGGNQFNDFGLNGVA